MFNVYQCLKLKMEGRPYILLAGIKTSVSGETPDKGWRLSLLETRGDERGEKIGRHRSPSRPLTPSFALSYICGTRFCPRLLFIFLAIDVNLAPIKAVAHVRDSARGRPRGRTRELAASVLLRFKEPIKIPRWPTLWLTNATCVRESTTRPDNRSRMWWRSDACVAAHRRKLLSLHRCTDVSSKLHAKRWIRESRCSRVQREAIWKKVHIYSASISTLKTCFERNIHPQVMYIFLQNACAWETWEPISFAWFGRKVTFINGMRWNRFRKKRHITYEIEFHSVRGSNCVSFFEEGN